MKLLLKYLTQKRASFKFEIKSETKFSLHYFVNSQVIGYQNGLRDENFNKIWCQQAL